MVTVRRGSRVEQLERALKKSNMRVKHLEATMRRVKARIDLLLRRDHDLKAQVRELEALRP